MEWNGVYGYLALGQGWAGGGLQRGPEIDNAIPRLPLPPSTLHHPPKLRSAASIFFASLSLSLPPPPPPLLCASFRNVNSINATSWGVFFFFFFFSLFFSALLLLLLLLFFFGGGGFGGKNRKRSVFLEIFYMFIYSYEWEWTRKIDWKCNIHVWILSIFFF